VGLCKPVMGAWQVMCAWAFVSQFLPHNSATLQFQILMSMQMDAKFKTEQIGTLFVWVGALGDGYWLVWGSRAPKPKNRVDVHYFFLRLLRSHKMK